MGLFDRLKGLRLVNVNNLFRQAQWGLFAPGMFLSKDGTLSDNIKEGYGKNPTVFGMINKLARMAANVPLIPMKGDKESEFDPMKEAFEDNEADYTYTEFKRHWFSFAYATGESLVYFPKFAAGNDKGKIMEQPDVMPTQDLIIESGGWRQMVKYYRIQDNDKIEMKPEDIWHTRIFLNLDFTGGKNYRGLAPISVAADIIRAMSETNKTIYQTLKKGLPPGILRNTDIKTQKLALESQALLDEEWEKKFAGSDNRGRPILGSGNLEWIPIGFSNFRDLQLIEASSMGRSILCNLWGVPEELFSSERSTLDNKNTARKLAYEDSTIPICQDYIDGLNKRIEPAYGITYKIDVSAIPAMQEDKHKIAQTMQIGRNVRAVTKNEFREAIGLETIIDSEFDTEGLIDESAMPDQLAQYQQGQRL